MITDKDIKKLSSVFATKDDLKSMEDRQDKKYATKDDLKSMEDRQDKKYATKDDLKNLPDKKYLEQQFVKQRKDISLDVATLIDDELHPQIDRLEKRIERVERYIGITAKSS